MEKGERTRLRVGGSHTGLTTRTRYCEKVTDKSYGRCKDLSTVHSDGPPSLSGKDKNCVPRDGDDEKESPSPVEKGERTRFSG